MWNDLDAKSRAYLAGAVRQGLPRGSRLLRVTFGSVTDYGSFSVHRDSRLVITDDTGRAQSLRLFGSAIEQAGRYKVFSYVTD